MKSPILALLIFIFVACNKNAQDPITTPAPLVTSGYHLQVTRVWGKETFFATDEKVLSFDSIRKKVTISGTSNEFQPSGVYPYRFYDTTVYILDPRTMKDIPQYIHLLYIATFKAERLYVNTHNKNNLRLTSDYLLWMADDEVEYDFLFK